MSYFYVPKNYTNLSNNFIFEPRKNESESENQTLTTYESKIEKLKFENKLIWNIYKEEYFYYKKVFNVIFENNDKSITTFNAIHRSFYIILELNNIFNFMEKYNDTPQIDTFHFSKSQSGVVQYLNSKRNQMNDRHVCIYCDEWEKNTDYLRKHHNLYFDSCISYNFISTDAVNYFNTHYSRKFDLITFLANEELDDLKKTLPLLSEKDYIIVKIIYSLIIQKKGGTLIFSIPDLFDETYYELLYILSSCYNKVVITKPVLVENTNNRKIIICSNYNERYNESELLNFAHVIINNILTRKVNTNITHLLDSMIPSFFLNKLREINIIMFQQTINATLSVINMKSSTNIREKLEKLNKKSLQKSVFWCVQNNFEYDTSVLEKYDSFISR